MDSAKQLLEEYEGIVEKITADEVIFHFINLEDYVGHTANVKPDRMNIPNLKEGDKIRCKEYSKGIWEFEIDSNPTVTNEFWAEVRENYQRQNKK